MILANYRRLAAIAAILVAAGTTGCTSTHQDIGQGNGALTSNSSAAAAYFPAIEARNAGRYPHLTEARAQLTVNQHLYPPTAR